MAPQVQVTGDAEAAARQHRERVARQAEARQRSYASHQRPAQQQVQGVHRQDVEQHVAGPQVRTHDCGHAGVVGVDAKGESEQLQVRRGQRQDVARRAEQRQQRPGTTRDREHRRQPHPSTGAERGACGRVGQRPIARTQLLSDGDADAQADDAQQQEESRLHAVGECERAGSCLRHARREREADEADSDAQQQLAEERPRKRDQRRPGCTGRGTHGLPRRRSATTVRHERGTGAARQAPLDAHFPASSLVFSAWNSASVRMPRLRRSSSMISSL